MTTKNNILALFKKENEFTIKELTDKLQVSKQMIHIAVKRLVEEGLIEKLGSPPKTIYRLLKVVKKGNIDIEAIKISEPNRIFLENNFLVITETGNFLTGSEAFIHWCDKRNQPVLKTLDEFISTKKKYSKYYDSKALINGSEKLIKTYDEKTFLDDIYYLDFYAIERFGKTRLGTLLHFAKQGQNKFLMKIMMDEIRGKIIQFIKNNKVDAISFVPPTIRREVQIMKFIKENINAALPLIEIKKISGIIPIPQKSLSKLDERITNATNSFAITDQRKFKKVLLIDDAVGSGATLNQIAEKIKNKKVAKQVLGLAIVGSFKGFDVITDI